MSPSYLSYIFYVSLLLRLLKPFLLASADCNRDLAVYEPVYDESANNKALANHVIKTINLGTFDQCLGHCMLDCRCLSMNIKNDKSECELNDATKETHPEGLVPKPGYKYQAIRCSNMNGISKCNDHCCNKGTCLNGGKCEITNEPKRRFHCTCAPGYTGIFCQYMLNCATILQSKPTAKSGIYTFYNSVNQKTFKAYCDMDVTNKQAWEMIESFSFARKDKFNAGFMVDLPVKDTTPKFESFRLPLAEMKNIRNNSMLWRVTCNYEQGIDIYEQDFMIGRFQDVDVLTTGKGCCLIQVLNMRGMQCEKCMAYMGSSATAHYHVAVVKSFRKCDFKINNGIALQAEILFGRYTYIVPGNTCTNRSTATTQWWFGNDLQ